MRSVNRSRLGGAPKAEERFVKEALLAVQPSQVCMHLFSCSVSMEALIWIEGERLRPIILQLPSAVCSIRHLLEPDLLTRLCIVGYRKSANRRPVYRRQYDDPVR